MSEDIKELVGRLKEESPRLSDGSNKIAQPYQWAIDALEALAGERDAWEKAAREHLDWRERNRERANAAEAERDRLKAALTEIKSLGFGAPTYKLGRNIKKAVEIARKALGGDAS